MKRTLFSSSSPLRKAPWRLAILGVAVATLLLVGGVSLSGINPLPAKAACCTGPLTLGDTLVNVSTGGDKEFFETQSGPPNAIFLVGNNASMREYATYLPEVGSALGCSDSALVSAMSWFNLSSTDPRLNGSQAFDPDPDFSTASLQFFNPALYYHSRGDHIAWEDDDWIWSLRKDFRGMKGGTPEAMCTELLYYNGDPQYATCVSCLKTRGWYRGRLESGSEARVARRRWILSGRVLNVRPPKFVVARKVVKDVIANVANLRMGVATFGYDRGWYDPANLIQPVKPTCSKSYPILDEVDLKRPELMKAINSIKFDNVERSIGEALFSLGGYYSSQTQDKKWEKWFRNPIGATYGYPGGPSGGNSEIGGWAYDTTEWTKSGSPWGGNGEQKSVCFACQASSVIVVTDGTPRADNSVPAYKMLELLKAAGAKHPDGTTLQFNPRDLNNPGGVNYCDLFGSTKDACDYRGDDNYPAGEARTNRNFMDDVAFFLANTDLRDDMSGTQSVRTYTIGYGDNSPMLQSIALAGKGKFYRADDPGQLRDAIMNAVGDLKESSTSFASANISSVQAGGLQSSAYVPRFVPRRGKQYDGHLYRFFFYSEFSQGCDTAKAKTAAGDPLDLNKDGDCEDTFFLDKPAGYSGAAGTVPDINSFTDANIVQENTTGAWVKVKTATVNAEGRLEGGQPAVPFWNLGETLGRRSASAACNPSDPLNPTGGRCLFTMIDRNGDSRFTEADNPPVPFEESQATLLRNYLLAAGDAFCAEIFTRQKRVWLGTVLEQDDCVRTVIRMVRGVDVFDEDNDGNVTEDRPCADNATRSCKLADIFHSSPVPVEPPVEPFLCELGLSGQCVSTLYDDFSTRVASEPVCASDGSTPKPCYAPTPMEPPLNLAAGSHGAYDEYRRTSGLRERIVLVGSNGGMLHAVHAGTAISGKTKGNLLDDVYDLGTGQELWGFIPPDLLPKLGLMVKGHEYYVDGTTLVRDIWADGAGGGGRPGVKEPREFRTVAILTERGGGNRYVALDVTDPRSLLTAGAQPFRWMFPNACDPEAATVGQSWMNFAPKPPPIGPVRLRKDSERRGWEERWVAFLNGGFSADLSRGRGVYMVDAWTGQKLWSVEAKPGASGGSDWQAQVVNRMMPVVAAPAMVDIGRADSVRLDVDGFFDTMVVGDVGGQVWTFRFHEPGDVRTGTVSNWYAARSLEVARQGAASEGQPEGFRKAPFFHIASNVLQPETGWLRSYLGTGDKQNLRAVAGKDCAPDNLLACIRMKCDVKVELAADVNGYRRTTVMEYDNGVLVKDQESTLGAVAATCGGGRLELTNLSIDCRDADTYGSGSFSFPPAAALPGTDAECSASGGSWSCTSRKLVTEVGSDIALGADAAHVTRNRYYGFHAYGGAVRTFATAAQAQAFDLRRVTDVPFSCSGESCSLTNVTIPDSAYATTVDASTGKPVRYVPASAMASLPRPSPLSPGWFLEYASVDEKTAAGSSVLGGIVFWPSFLPPSGALAACSTLGGGDSGRSWQADVITGLPDQADSFRVRNASGNLLGYLPHKTRSVLAPPPEPASVISLSKSGGIRYQVAVADPGAPPSTETLRQQSNVSPDIYWLEVPRNTHQCRHEDARACR